MYDYFVLIVSQHDYNLALAIIGGGLVAYSLASAMSTAMIGVVLFPGLTVGALASMALAKHVGLIVGRDQDLYLIGVCALGLLATLFVYYILYNFLDWLLSYSRREHRMLIERSGEQATSAPAAKLPQHGV